MAIRVGQTFARPNTGFDGSELLQPGCGLLQYNASLEMTMFRPLPEVDSNGQLLPWCTPEGYLTEWLYPIAREGKGRLVQSAGQSRRVTFDCDPSDNQGLAETPYERLYRIAVGRWPSLGERRPTAGPILPVPSPAFLVQCLLYIRASKKGGKGGPTPQSPKTNVVLLMSQTAYSAITRMLTMKDVNGNLMVTDFMASNSPGAVVLMNDASPITSPMGWMLQACSNFGQQQQQGGTDIATRYQAGYVVPNVGQLAAAGMAMPPAPSDDYCRRTWVPWNRVARRLTAEEQVKLLSTAFDAQIILEGFRDSEFAQYVPDAIMRSGTTQVQGAPSYPPAAQPPLPPTSWVPTPAGHAAPPQAPPPAPPQTHFAPPAAPPQAPPTSWGPVPTAPQTAYAPSQTNAAPPQSAPPAAPPVQHAPPAAPPAAPPVQHAPPAAAQAAAPVQYPGAVDTSAYSNSMSRLNAVRAKMAEDAERARTQGQPVPGM